MTHCKADIAIAVSLLHGLGNDKVSRLLQAYPGVTRDELHSAITRLFPRTRDLSPSDLDLALQRADTILDRCSQEGIEVITPLHPHYPDRLRSIRGGNAIPILYVKGSTALLARKNAVAIVGTRKPSSRGRKIAAVLTEVLVSMGYTAISGLALGIDSVVHQTAIRDRGNTIAVLAHGLDIVAPPRNRTLAESILNQGGTLVSEYSPETPPSRYTFVRRNRIQSALSLGSVIVEASEKGGTISHAASAMRLGRHLMLVIPPSPYDRGLDTSGARAISREARARNYPRVHTVANSEQFADLLAKLQEDPGTDVQGILL